MKLIKRGSTYHATFKTQHGIQSVSTKCTDKAEALRTANAAGIKELEFAARSGAVTAQAIGKIVTGRKLTIAKAIGHYRVYLESISKSPKTIENNATTVEAWAKECDVMNQPPSAIDETIIGLWINRTTDSKASTRSVNLSALRSFFGYCAAKGWSVGDPARLAQVNLKGLTHQQKERDEREVFEPYEIKRMLKYLEDNGETFWLFATRTSLETALRLGDICQLEWDCLQEAKRINVWTDKRDQRVSVPMSDAMSEAIGLIPVTHHRYMFPEQRKIANDLKKRASLSVQFGRLLAKCDVTGKSFHCLRHTCITRWDKEGKSLETIGHLVGHQSEEVTKGYIHK